MCGVVNKTVPIEKSVSADSNVTAAEEATGTNANPRGDIHAEESKRPPAKLEWHQNRRDHSVDNQIMPSPLDRHQKHLSAAYSG
jgi:hypothetical protein